MLDDRYDTDIFAEPTIKGTLGTNALKAQRHLCDHIVYNSTNERDFVAETKGSMSSIQLRLIEESNIHCAREHFKAISNGNVVYDVVDSYKTLLERVMK